MKTRDSFLSNTYEKILPYAGSGLLVLGRVGTKVPERQPVTDDEAISNGIRRFKAIAAGTLALGLVNLGYNALTTSEDNSRQYNEKIEACASVLVGHEVDLKYDPDHIAVSSPIYREVEACRANGGDPDMARFDLDHPDQFASS